MSDTQRCEPGDPTVDGWHWVQQGEFPPTLARWHPSDNPDTEPLWTSTEHVYSGTPRYAAREWGWRYLAPVTPAPVVGALVEALEGLLVGCEYRPGGYSFAFGDDVPAGWGTKTIPTDAALDAARSALAAAKEAGP